jgi:hypothetical protein
MGSEYDDAACDNRWARLLTRACAILQLSSGAMKSCSRNEKGTTISDPTNCRQAEIHMSMIHAVVLLKVFETLLACDSSNDLEIFAPGMFRRLD